MRNPKYKEYIKDSPTPGDEYCMTGNYLNFLEEEYDEKVAETDKILASDELLPPGSAVSTNRPEDGILEVIEIVKSLSYGEGKPADASYQGILPLGKNGDLYLVQTRIIERVDEE